MRATTIRSKVLTAKLVKVDMAGSETGQGYPAIKQVSGQPGR